MSLVSATGSFVASIIMTAIGVVSLGLSIYQMITAKGIGELPVPKPNNVDNLPTAEQGKPIPVVFGTKIIANPNVVWWGYARNTRISMLSSEIVEEKAKDNKPAEVVPPVEPIQSTDEPLWGGT